jgi:hypothetical protein
MLGLWYPLCSNWVLPSSGAHRSDENDYKAGASAGRSAGSPGHFQGRPTIWSADLTFLQSELDVRIDRSQDCLGQA